jgi:hypothetical protein
MKHGLLGDKLGVSSRASTGSAGEGVEHAAAPPDADGLHHSPSA